MKVKIVFWYPSKLETKVPAEIDDNDLIGWIAYLNGMGLNLAFPKNFLEIQTIYVDEKMFSQR